jgi:hypothetical protein
MNFSMGTSYFYNNGISDVDGYGTHVALYKGGGAGQDFGGTIWFVHNSFNGGGTALEWAGADSTTGAPGYRFINNLYNSTRVISAGIATSRIGAWSNNAHRGSFSVSSNPPGPAGYDGKNIILSAPIWNTSRIETGFVLPERHPARHAGIDVSHSFTIRDTNYSALAPFSSSYFSGPAPNMGAVQDAPISDPPLGRRERSRD